MRDYFLQTRRLGFSHWLSEDLPLALSLWGDSQVTKYISSGGFTEKEIESRLEKELESQQQWGVSYWPLFTLAENQFIGCCGLRHHDGERIIYEIGIHLKPEHWGRGYGPEAAEAVIQYAFSCLNAYDIVAGHHPENLPSRKTLERLGFHSIGNRFYPPTGLYHPCYRYCAFTDDI